MLSGFWFSTPKRDSTPKHAPLAPKLATTTPHEYPPRPSYDIPWEHVKLGPPSSPDIDDEATFERLGYSQVYGAARRREAPPPLPPPRLPLASPSVPMLQEERDRLRQQLETSFPAQCNAASGRERKVTNIRSNVHAGWRDGSPGSNRPEREPEKEREPNAAAVAAIDGLKEENVKLNTALQLQTQQLDAAQEEMKQERSRLQSEGERLDAIREEMKQERSQLQSEAEKLDVAREEMKQERLQLQSETGRLDAAREEMKQERSQLQSEAERLDAVREAVKQERSQLQSEVEKLDVAREEMKQERSHLQSETERLDAAREEMKQERSQLQSGAERLDAAREAVKQERSQLQSEAEKLDVAREEMKQERSQLQSETERLDAAWEEMEQGRCHLQSEAERLDASWEEVKRERSQLQSEAEKLDAIREEMKQERSQSQSEAEKLKAELYAAHEVHKGEVESLKMSLQGHVQRVERVGKDRNSIKDNLNAEIDQLKLMHAKETEQAKTTLEEVNFDRMQVYSELRKVRNLLDAYGPEQNANHREIETLRRELSDAKDSKRVAAELQQRLDIQNKELDSAREESSALRKEFNQFLTLLDDGTKELQLESARGFVTTADAFSGAEVTHILQRLNAEVLQSTAFMAESMVELFLDDTMTQVSKTDEQFAACKRASGTIGGVIVHFLCTKKHKDDPILIQIAFQAYLTYHLRCVARTWVIGGDEGHNRFINAIYQSMHEKETQAIAGRWRALTRAHVPPTSFDNSQIALQIATKIISGLSDILLTAGCTAPKSDIASSLSSKFAEKLSFLVSLAMRVNKIIGKDVTSGDFEVIAVLPATAFDVMTMEDSYDDGVSAKSRGNNMAKVLCATDLGLRKKTRVGMTGENQWETKVLLKPKVALESVVDIIDAY